MRMYTVVLLLLAGLSGLHAEDKNQGQPLHPMLRGRPQNVFLFHGRGDSASTRPQIIYLSGDAGMFGEAEKMAAAMAAWGYTVYALDSKHYLESFTDGKKTLGTGEVMSDLAALAAWAGARDGRRVILSGWSEGAGLALLGAAGDSARSSFLGLVAVGLAEQSFLGWRTLDAITWITKKDPDEPMFDSAPFLPRVAPLPLVLIQSSADEYVSREASQKMFDLAGEPKRFFMVESEDHKFKGGKDTFYDNLRESLGWVCAASPPAKP
ncbi:hypothetical protein LLH00_08270 [bacterium]|nr:hypothetical protein [bacterium]